MSFDNPSSFVVIDSNTIDYGISTSGATYYYSTGLELSADALVTNNSMGGLASFNTLINIYAGSSIIKNNKLNRGPNTILYYIAASSASDQIITNNVFDSATVDSEVNETLVTGLTTSSVYKENRNQTSYMAVSKVNNTVYPTPYTTIPLPNTSSELTYNYYGDFASTLELFFLSYASGSGAGGTGVKVMFDLNDYLPDNVQILSMVVGLQMINYSVYNACTGGSAALYSQVSLPANYSLTSLTGSLADVNSMLLTANHQGNVPASFTLGGCAGQVPLTTFATATQYLSIDATSVPAYYITGKNTKITVLYDTAWGFNAANGTMEILESPLLVRYRWL